MSELNEGVPSPPPAPQPGPEAIREFADRGAQWLFEDPENVRGLLQIREPALAERLDFARAQRINRTFVPADLRQKESDLIYRVPFRRSGRGRAREVWVYVLLEHQSEPDPLMGLRLYLYMGQLWDSQRREWETRRVSAARRRLSAIIPVVFYTGENRWEAPIGLESLMDLTADLEPFVPRWETLFVPLHQTPAEALTRFATAMGWALRVWQAERVPPAEMERVLAEAMAGLERLTEEQAGQWARAAMFFLQLIVYRREEQELVDLVFTQARRSKFREKEEVLKVGMTIAERVAAEARVEQSRRSLKTVLVARFGPLPPEIEHALAAANLEMMDTWLARAATAQTLTEVGILPPTSPQ